MALANDAHTNVRGAGFGLSLNSVPLRLNLLFGHGPVFGDFNFEQDRNAARLVLAMSLPMVLVPHEAARKVRLRRADLKTLETHSASLAWVA